MEHTQRAMRNPEPETLGASWKSLSRDEYLRKDRRSNYTESHLEPDEPKKNERFEHHHSLVCGCVVRSDNGECASNCLIDEMLPATKDSPPIACYVCNHNSESKYVEEGSMRASAPGVTHFPLKNDPASVSNHNKCCSSLGPQYMLRNTVRGTDAGSLETIDKTTGLQARLNASIVDVKVSKKGYPPAARAKAEPEGNVDSTSFASETRDHLIITSRSNQQVSQASNDLPCNVHIQYLIDTLDPASYPETDEEAVWYTQNVRLEEQDDFAAVDFEDEFLLALDPHLRQE